LNIYETFIFKSRYSRWIEAEKRREEFPETVKRYFDFMEAHLKEQCNYKLKKSLRSDLEAAVLRLDIVPSMRALATAGPALDRCNVAGFNCSYLPIDSPRSFDELFYILLCGTGVGYSVERQYIAELPSINEHFEKSQTVVHVEDSKAGWARGLRELIACLYVGQIPSWDVSKVRPAGARLKTFGGRASGPGPLVDLFNFTVNLFKTAAGRKLNSLECHDLCCKIAAAVVVGGVRRSAMISLSNLSDIRMRDAKTGNWSNINADRAFANNSVVYTEKPDMGVFLQEWKSLYESHSGERGIFNRIASQKQAAANGRRNSTYEFGTNPCSEIILRPYQFCNLTEVVVRGEDTVDTLRHKIRLATILGTFQSTLTNFKYLRKIWTKNTEEERLLGVSLTGICDNAFMSNSIVNPYDGQHVEEGRLKRTLEHLKNVAIETNKQFADDLDIPQSAAITCVKPSGTVSQLVNSASGIHPRHAPYYIRRVRGDSKDPLSSFLKDQGVPVEPCAYKPESTVIFSFPVGTDNPSGVYRNSRTALEQLELWLIYQEHWCEHKPSITVYVKEDEWLEVGAWVYKNFDKVSGISFLPFDGGAYTQAPYEEITIVEYEKLLAAMPASIDWARLKDYEKEDGTIASQEFACVGEICEIVDINK
jgi:ribonucleoside-triphosphate reductase